MYAIQETHIEIGSAGSQPVHFASDCTPGDWQMAQVSFKTHFQTSDNVRVIVTANNEGVNPGVENPAVVGVVAAVNTTDFTLLGRNSDCAEGNAGFYYMAVEELGHPPPGERVDLRLGILQQRSFSRDCQPGDRNVWSPSFSSPLPSGERAALVTGCNLNVRSYNLPAVGMSRNLDVNGFQLAARNSAACLPLPGDSGESAFYYVAGIEGPTPPRDRFWIDSGVVEPKSFAASCMSFKDVGSHWASWEVYFSRPFLSPPVVLLTGKDVGAAVVGLAQDVTTHGFTLTGFNSDCGPGSAQFYWVAIGCGSGCG
jgi:hypothetical protein